MRSTSGTGIVERAAEHQPGRHLLRHLVDRARGVDVLRARRLQQHPVVDEPGEVVRVRVAEVHRERVGAVLLADRREARVDRRERLVPRHFAERVAVAHAAAVRTRSGSASSCLIAVPFGHRKPWLNTSSRSPRTSVISSPSRCSSSPHVASHRWHVRYSVRVMPVRLRVREPLR